MLKEMQLSCESTVQILDDVLIFDGLRENQGAKQRCVIGVNGLFRRLLRELSPLVGHNNPQDNPRFSSVSQEMFHDSLHFNIATKTISFMLCGRFGYIAWSCCCCVDERSSCGPEHQFEPGKLGLPRERGKWVHNSVSGLLLSCTVAEYYCGTIYDSELVHNSVSGLLLSCAVAEY